MSRHRWRGQLSDTAVNMAGNLLKMDVVNGKIIYCEIVHGNQGRLLGIAIGTRPPKPVLVPGSPWAMPPTQETYFHSQQAYR